MFYNALNLHHTVDPEYRRLWRRMQAGPSAAELAQALANARKRRRNEKRLARGYRPRHVRASV